MKVADYIVQTLVDAGVTECFLLSGGANMYLCDAFANQTDIRVTCCATENGCVAAAESYFRLTGRLAVVCVTAGPGALNCITAVHGAYVDSMGVIILSGQCDTQTATGEDWKGELLKRQTGDQEAPVSEMVRFITKHVVYLNSSSSVNYSFTKKAIQYAKSRRPGPVWFDIPVDVQKAEMPEGGSSVRTYPEDKDVRCSIFDVHRVLVSMWEAERPVIMLGSGIRIAGAEAELEEVLASLGVPVVTAFNGHDLVGSDHPLYVGRQGTIGDIPGNLAVQKSDYLLILGSRVTPRSVGFTPKAFAPHATIIRVDVDRDEAEGGVVSDLKWFLQKMCDLKILFKNHRTWLNECKGYQTKYPVVKAEYRTPTEKDIVNPYIFLERLFEQLRDDDIIVCGNGSAVVMTFQAARIKQGQRMYSNGGSAAMGWALGAAIGAARGAKPGQRVICIDGDGSLAMGSPELATIKRHNLPIKIFVINNNGYHSIRQTFRKAFPGRDQIGYDSTTGIGFPMLGRLAKAYCLNYRSVTSFVDNYGMDSLEIPSLTEVDIDPSQSFCPRIAFPMPEEALR